MSRTRRRPVNYLATSLNDGTVLMAAPVRKPYSRTKSRKPDPDNICTEYPEDWKAIFDPNNPSRFRFQDVVSTSLNTRRIIRQLVLPELQAIMGQVQLLKEQLEDLEEAISSRHSPGKGNVQALEGQAKD